MIVITLIAIALCIGVEYLRPRFRWVEPVTAIAAVLFLFFVLPRLIGPGPVEFQFSQNGFLISCGLVAAYLVGRRAWKIYMIATGRMRSESFSFISQAFQNLLQEHMGRKPNGR